MSSLPRRIFSSAVLVSLVLGTLFYFPIWVFVCVILGFIGLGLYEFFTMVRQRGILIHRLLGVSLGIIFGLLVAFSSFAEAGLISAPSLMQNVFTVRWLLIIFWPAIIIIVFIRQLFRENSFEALSGLATTIFGLIYIALLFSYFFHIRALDPIQGAWLVLFLILVTKMGDAGAFIIGKTMGRHILLARISPNKTVEGLIGGILVSGSVAVLARDMLGSAVSPAPALLLGIFLGFCGQLGDFAESMLKRDCQVKDTSATLPGLGGVLDVLDSLLFTAPVFYGILVFV